MLEGVSLTDDMLVLCQYCSEVGFCETAVYSSPFSFHNISHMIESRGGLNRKLASSSLLRQSPSDVTATSLEMGQLCFNPTPETVCLRRDSAQLMVCSN